MDITDRYSNSDKKIISYANLQVDSCRNAVFLLPPLYLILWRTKLNFLSMDNVNRLLSKTMEK